MLISADGLAEMVMVALVITTAAPLILLLLLLFDWMKGQLW
jgi:hypothetical protein